jgi:hypothetical protein
MGSAGVAGALSGAAAGGGAACGDCGLQAPSVRANKIARMRELIMCLN